MLAGRERVLPVDLEELQAEQVVTEGRLAVLGVEAQAAESAALGDDHALCSPFRNLDLGREGERLVLRHHDRVLGEPAHAAEEDLPVAAHQLRPAGEVGVEALDATVVEREDVVLPRLEDEQRLQLRELLRLLGGKVVRLRPVVRRVELPDVLGRAAAVSAITHGVECRVTAVQPSW